MKNYTVLLFVLLYSTFAFSQTSDDYTKALNLLSKAFNEKNASLVHQNFSSELKNQIKEVDFKTDFKNLHTEKGNITSYELIMDEDNVKNYLVEFENSTMLLLISLTKDVKISLFEIKEY